VLLNAQKQSASNAAARCARGVSDHLVISPELFGPELAHDLCFQPFVRALRQDFDDVNGWEAEYAGPTLVTTVLADFCHYYGLSVAGTQLKHGRDNLHPHEVLQRVRMCCQHV